MSNGSLGHRFEPCSDRLGEMFGEVRLGEEAVLSFLLELGPDQFGAVAAGEDDFQIRTIHDEGVRELPTEKYPWDGVSGVKPYRGFAATTTVGVY